VKRLIPWLLAACTFAIMGHARAEPCREEVEAAERVATERVDLNRADEAALVALPGIGSARAKAILEYRTAHGGFRNLSQLLQVRGIGRALLKRLRPLVTLSS
jgi:competence ComEA-like helix-hairpin-helix protein